MQGIGRVAIILSRAGGSHVAVLESCFTLYFRPRSVAHDMTLFGGDRTLFGGDMKHMHARHANKALL